MRQAKKQSNHHDVGAQRFEPSTPDDSPRVVIAQEPDANELALIEQSVLNYNLERAGPHRYQKLAAFLREPGGQVLGGIIGSTYWGWLQIDFLWVPTATWPWPR